MGAELRGAEVQVPGHAATGPGGLVPKHMGAASSAVGVAGTPMTAPFRFMGGSGRRRSGFLWRLLLLKGGYLLVLLGVAALGDRFDTDMFHRVMARWPHDGEPVFASHLATWDAAHYLSLSERGYQPGTPDCAFYPLWPLLVRWCAPLFDGSHVLTGLALSNVLSLAAWLLFHHLVVRRWGKPVATWALIFLIAFPGSLFFQFNYTESLFLLLVLLLWQGLEEERAGLAAATALGPERGAYRVGAGNYGGKLGRHHFHLKDLI